MSIQKDKSQSVNNTAGKGVKGGDNSQSQPDSLSQPQSQPQDKLVDDTKALFALNQQAAHQLNNQLGIIRGNLEMLSMELSLSGKSEQRLVKINSAIDSASDIVTSLHSNSIAFESCEKNHPTPSGTEEPAYDVATNVEQQSQKQVSPEEAIQQQAIQQQAIQQQVIHQQKSVLIVDDEEDLVEVVMRQLQFRGYRTYCATSAEAAIEILASDPCIDLIFSDVVMNNGMNGLQLARYVFDNYPNMKILLTTGHTQQLEKSQHSHDELICSLLMAKLPKPFTHQELVNAIQELL